MTTEMKTGRRYPVGAECAAGGAHFRVWAPGRERVFVLFEDPGGRELALEREPGGYFSGWAPDAKPGASYRFRLDDDGAFPDPASRFQPRGPHGPSRLVDPSAYSWGDAGWPGARREGQVVYELHAGTFTREGTWKAAVPRLAELAELGVTTLEVMPVSDYPGRFGWGYDGVNLFAPCRLYGEPDDFRAFVDAAHAAGLAVILDVVYNHLGPDGNFLPRFSPRYFSDEPTEWGAAMNFDGLDCAPVREYIVFNAAYWIDEYHLDGLRLDATHAIRDASPEHVIAEIARAARAAAGDRSIVIFAENEPQVANLARPVAEGGLGLDSLWNDDFHHAAHVALTGGREAYYDGYLGSAQEFISCLLRGFLYQGQFYDWQGKTRGSRTDGLPPSAFIHFLENHDQVANSFDGRRLHQLCDPGRLRAMTALLLLGPQTPMLFQGQEFNASNPFLYFADHTAELNDAVRDGRRSFLRQFPSLSSPDAAAAIADPSASSTFERCKLDHAERRRNAGALALHRDLLRLRRDDPAFREARPGGLSAAVLGDAAFVVRFAARGGGERLLVVNLGAENTLRPAAEPLLAPPGAEPWRLLWSSERPEYGGRGVACPFDAYGRWRLPANCATVLEGSAHG